MPSFFAIAGSVTTCQIQDAEYFGEKSGQWHVQEFNLLSLIRWNFINVCALYRKNLWEQVGGYDEQMPWIGLEDWDFWLRVASHGGSFFHLAKVGFDYRARRSWPLTASVPWLVPTSWSIWEMKSALWRRCKLNAADDVFSHWKGVVGFTVLNSEL